MSSTRSVISPPVFAQDASTSIPPTPIQGVSYRDPVAGPASSPDGWPYGEVVNSAEFNQIMYQMSSILSILDKKGILGWSSDVDYSEASLVFGSDGIVYSWISPSGPTLGGAKDPISSPTFWKTLLDSRPATKRIEITASGTYTPTPGMKNVFVQVQAAGGGGGGSTGAGTGAAAASGGSAGGYSEGYFTAAAIGASQSVTVGVGGIGGSSGSVNGTAGTASSFGALLTATGGSFGGSTGNSTQVVRGAPPNSSGGGTGSTQNGQNGQIGTIFGPTNTAIAGSGGSSRLGTGGAGRNEGSNGFSGQGYGSGGAGAASSTITQSGGPGGNGIVIITEYF